MFATITYEGFHADKIGSWYYFIDADFNKNGMLGAYTEISREFTFAKVKTSSSFAGHIEIDAGLSKSGNQFQSALLLGPAWNWHNKSFSKTLSVQVMYKQFFGQKIEEANGTSTKTRPYCSFQVTGVWGLNFGYKDRWRFDGFIDFWRGKNSTNGHGCLVILTEPQIWYNLSRHCAFGSEWEMSNNFIYKNCGNFANDGFYVNPTVAFKYTF